MVGQAAYAVAHNLAQEAQHAAESKYAAKLAALKAAQAAQQKAAVKAAANAAAALEEGDGTENLVTGAAVSCSLCSSSCLRGSCRTCKRLCGLSCDHIMQNLI